MKKAKYKIGDLLIYNSRDLYSEDRLFHVHDLRYGYCTGDIKKQYWYAGLGK